MKIRKIKPKVGNPSRKKWRNELSPDEHLMRFLVIVLPALTLVIAAMVAETGGQP